MIFMTQKFAAIITGPDTYLDHLGTLCYILKMPLFVTEKETYESALTFYPQIETIYLQLQDLSAPFLMEHFDAIFESGKFFSMNLSPMIKLLSSKKLRFIYCPHGHSDKGHSAKQFASQDISLVYGAHMQDLLKNTGALEKIETTVRTGNYRLTFYQKHKTFYDTLVANQILPLLNPSNQTILYAPSWQDGENPTSFFTCVEKLIADLKNNFNLIIKLHPFLAEFHPAETFSILEKYKKSSDILFLNQFPCIYPLLQICDLYIGDYSSIGYDFLAFNKPLYFLIEKKAPLFAIHPCGMVIPPEENTSCFIHKTLKKNQLEKEALRKKIYRYAFGEEIPFDSLKQEITKAILTEKKPALK